jgi:hypothetical protein
MDIADLIEEIRHTPYCIVYPPEGLPTLREDHRLPDDLYQFYELCGGVRLFDGSLDNAPDPDDPETEEFLPAPLYIFPPNYIMLTNIRLFDFPKLQKFRPSDDDISWSWYIIGNDYDYDSVSGLLSIDCHPARLGRCYDSYWVTHPSQSPIIAHSFTELLTNFLRNTKYDRYWHIATFTPLGTAYQDQP